MGGSRLADQRPGRSSSGTSGGRLALDEGGLGMGRFACHSSMSFDLLALVRDSGSDRPVSWGQVWITEC